MERREIVPGARPVGLALFFPKKKALCITDLHLGMEEEFQKKGTLLPRFNFEETKKRLERAFEETGRLEETIILGDLKHEFGRISGQEWQEVLGALELIQKHSKKIVLLRGNHDTILGPIALRKRLEVKEEHFFLGEKTLFLHGDKIPKTQGYRKAKTIVIGHEHPAITLRDGAKAERFKCFLKGKFGRKTIIALPSFNSFSEGTDVLREKPLSPFLEGSLGEFEAWIAEGKAHYFGKLCKISV